MKTYLAPKFIVERDPERCIRCQVCVNQCSFGAHYYDAEDDEVRSYDENCVGCHRCAIFCPTQALTIRRSPQDYRENYNWRPEAVEDIIKQAETGGVLLTGMGNDKGYRIYWDHLVLNASQVTNPSIDPLREPMELTTYLGRKPDKVELNHDSISLKTELAPQVKVELPVMFAAIIVISEISTLANRGQNMSLYWGFFLVGSSLGPTLGGFIGEYLGDRAAFFCFSGLAFLSTLWFYLRLPETKKRATNPGSRVLFTGLKPLLGNLNFALISTVALATLFTLTGSQLTIVPLLGYERFDLTRGQVGLALTLVAIMQFILVLVAGRLSDRFGRKKLIVPGNLIAVLGLVMFALSPSYFLYLMSAVILGIGRGVGGAIPTAYAADIAPPGNYENTMAVYRLASDSGFVLGPVILGLLKDTFGLNFPLFFSALLLFVPVVLFGTLAKETIHPS